jgi:hypothetical protein
MHYDEKITMKFSWVAFLVFAAMLFRFVNPFFPALSNFTPIGAMALFGAAYFTNKKWAFILPLAAMWLSDLVLNNFVYARMYPEYYTSFSWMGDWSVYLAFGLIVALGMGILQEIRPARLALAGISASLLFFLVSNFGVWVGSGMYPMTFEGLLQCFVAAIPFFRNTLLGDFFYIAVLFGAAEYIKLKRPYWEKIQ